MKKIICLVLVCIFILSSASISFADTVKIGKEYTIEDVCSFTVNSAKEYDVFLNQESGGNKQWIVVSADILNWRDDSFYVKTETSAKVIYDGEFEYIADYLWTKPVGTYYREHDDFTIWISEFDANGKMYITGDDTLYGDKCSSNEITVWVDANVLSGALSYYDPITDVFNYYEGNSQFVSQDPSKTVLNQLEERTYYYVFQVPDLVAEEEGARELIFTVAGEEYAFRF